MVQRASDKTVTWRSVDGMALKISSRLAQSLGHCHPDGEDLYLDCHDKS